MWQPCAAGTVILAVGFFSLLRASPTEPALQQRVAAVALWGDWRVHMNPWQDYSRGVASRETANVLVACVQGKEG
jgi:hypothetical protein